MLDVTDGMRSHWTSLVTCIDADFLDASLFFTDLLSLLCLLHDVLSHTTCQ